MLSPEPTSGPVLPPIDRATPSAAAAAHAAMPRAGVGIDPAAEGTVYFALVKSVGHDMLLDEYRRQYGDVEGENELGNQFGHIFEEARVRAAVRVEAFARYAPGRGFFTTRDPADAFALVAEMIRVAEDQNATIP